MEYLADQDKKFNTEAFETIRDIELFLKRDIRERLEDHYGPSWFKKGVPVKVYREASTLAAEKNRELDHDEEVEPWDCLHIRDYQQILQHDHGVWVERFSSTYTRPEDDNKPGGWKAKTSWIAELNRIRNENDHTYSVKESEYDLLVSLRPGSVSELSWPSRLRGMKKRSSTAMLRNAFGRVDHKRHGQAWSSRRPPLAEPAEASRTCHGAPIGVRWLKSVALLGNAGPDASSPALDAA